MLQKGLILKVSTKNISSIYDIFYNDLLGRWWSVKYVYTYWSCSFIYEYLDNHI